MNKIIVVFFLLIMSITVLAQRTLIYATGSGEWSRPFTWSLNRVPVNNDSILIPAGRVVTISTDLSLLNVVIRISGTLVIDEAPGNGNSNDLDLITTSNKSTEAIVRLLSPTSKIQRGIDYGGSGRIRVQVNNTGSFITKFYTSASIQTGPAIAFNNATSAFIQQPESSLPIVLLEFLISNTDKSVGLKWKSQQENNNERYFIERSSDAKTWHVVAEVKAVPYSTVPQNYYYTDESPSPGINYYRLRIVNHDGKFGITQVKAARISNSSSKPGIYPNPANTTATIFVKDENVDNFLVCIYNRNGQFVTRYQSENGSNIIQIDVSNLSQGDYTAEVISNTGKRQLLRFMVARK